MININKKGEDGDKVEGKGRGKDQDKGQRKEILN